MNLKAISNPILEPRIVSFDSAAQKLQLSKISSEMRRTVAMAISSGISQKLGLGKLVDFYT